MVGLVVAGAAVVSFFMNMRLSIEFTGGLQMTIDELHDKDQLTQQLNETLQAEYPGINVGVQSSPAQNTTSLLLNIDIKDDMVVQDISRMVTQTLMTNNYISSEADILSQALNGPSVSEYIKTTALTAIILGLVFMIVYILISFREIRQTLSPALLALVVFVTMLFDMIIPAGAYGLLMMINPIIQVDMIFVIAMLTTMWYSINDTIIIMDRVRENMLSQGGAKKGNVIYGHIFEKSIKQTLRRSLGTSGSTLAVIIALFIFGTGIVQNFAFTMGIGIIAGTYSSIFLAAPLLYILQGSFKKEYKKL